MLKNSGSRVQMNQSSARDGRMGELMLWSDARVSIMAGKGYVFRDLRKYTIFMCSQITVQILESLGSSKSRFYLFFYFYGHGRINNLFSRAMDHHYNGSLHHFYSHKKRGDYVFWCAFRDKVSGLPYRINLVFGVCFRKRKANWSFQ